MEKILNSIQKNDRNLKSNDDYHIQKKIISSNRKDTKKM